MPTLLQAVARELERSRDVSAQVVDHLIGTYGLNRDAIGSFLVGELPKLEDYEIDLLLSPLFTPALSDQAIFAELLGSDSVPANEWPELVQQLVAHPTRTQLVTENEQAHSVPLHNVTIERYVHRLKLRFTAADQRSERDEAQVMVKFTLAHGARDDRQVVAFLDPVLP